MIVYVYTNLQYIPNTNEGYFFGLLVSWSPTWLDGRTDDKRVKRAPGGQFQAVAMCGQWWNPEFNGWKLEMLQKRN